VERLSSRLNDGEEPEKFLQEENIGFDIFLNSLYNNAEYNND
jgi:hypothetical protein